jgi:hypothetical protein
MSIPWWALAFIGLYDVCADRPTLKTRVLLYAAAALIVLAVVIDWL